MDKRKSDAEQVKSQLELGEKVEELLEKSGKENSVEEPGDWRESVLEIGMLTTAVAVGILIFSSSFDGIYAVQQSPMLGWVIRIALGFGVLVAYIRGRSAMQEMLFPRINKEIIRTVYKISPDLLDDGTEDEEEEILMHKNALATYVMLFGFTILIVAFLLLNPRVLEAAFGLISEGNIASAIIKIILVCFAAGVYLSLRDLLFVYKEYDHLRVMIWRIRRIGKGKTGLELLNAAMPESHHSLIFQRLTAIRRIMKIKGHIAPADLRDQTFLSRSLTGSIANYLTAALPILGLIGTIFGLTIAIGGLEQVMGTALENKSEFTKSIAQSVEGIGTAFYTTLAGTISMLILRFYSMISKNAHTNFLVDMRNILAIEILPRLQKNKPNKIEK